MSPEINFSILYSGPAKRKAQGRLHGSAKRVGKGSADRQCFSNSKALDVYLNSLRPLQGIRTHIIFKRTSEKETSLGIENSEVQVSLGDSSVSFPIDVLFVGIVPEVWLHVLIRE